ncbi:MAG: hypothetical protein WCC52_01850 [Nitrosotalea sp.]
MAFIQCVNNECKEQFDLPSDFLSNFENVVLNGKTGVPQWETTCPHCGQANFVTPNFRVVSEKD